MFLQNFVEIGTDRWWGHAAYFSQVQAAVEN